MGRLVYLVCCLTLSHLLVPISFADEPTRSSLNIGLLIMATGKYTIFIEKLINSAESYFLLGHKKTYYIFTDGLIPNGPNIIRIEQKRLGWPYDTMMRFAVYAEAENFFSQMDYIFACDADMFFVATVGDEILGDRVATRHPGFILPEHRKEDYERNPLSTACVQYGEGEYYFAGGFYGGSRKEFLQIATICAQRIVDDLTHGIIARWHDESHLNRYFIDNPPSLILNPSYCYPEHWDLPFVPRLMAISKNHAEFQTQL